MSEHDVVFHGMGCELRLIVGPPLRSGLPSAARAAAEARALLDDFGERLSRFRPDSELAALNADRRPVVPASPLLRDAIRAGLWAAERTGGLVVPTLTGALARAGYARSRAGVANAPLAAALAAAPPRRPATADPAAAWREIAIDDEAGTIARPPGLLLDTGGTGKGQAADLVAARLGGYARYVVDAAGDLRIGGVLGRARPYSVEVEHPFAAEPLGFITVGGGAIATSGIASRLWRRPGGGFAHHLLDPSTGVSAWTGVVSATALAPSALEAETLAKWALLGGPDTARAVLARHGGVFVRDDGQAEWIAAPGARNGVAA